MKKLLSDRRFAAVVLAAVLLVFTPIGARRSLKGAVDRVEARFFTGVDGRGAIADYLEDAQRAALGLIAVGSGYDAAGELRADREALLDALEGRDISEIARANALVVSSFAALREKLLTLPLSESDAEDLEYYSGQFEGAEGAVSHSGYSEAAAEFTAGTYARFPAKIIGGLLGVDPPETFE